MNQATSETRTDSQVAQLSAEWVVKPADRVVVTGAAGFVGSRVVTSLLGLGFQNIRCLVRRSSDLSMLKTAIGDAGAPHCELVEGTLLSTEDCSKVSEGAKVVYHLVAGRGKSFPGCFQGSAVTTRNLLDALVRAGVCRRFVNVSSFAVYSNWDLRRGAVWDETCAVERNYDARYDAYAYGKIKQDDLVLRYHAQHGLPYAIVRPGIVFGPGKKAIPGFVGMDTFGAFLHLGGGGRVPLTYVDNCADAIVLAGLVKGVDCEVFNVVDDDLPTSRFFLRQYKKKVRSFPSIWLPYSLAFLLCAFWERYATWSKGQLPPVFNRRMCAFAWKGHQYSNRKVKQRLGWQPRVSMPAALENYFAYQRNG